MNKNLSSPEHSATNKSLTEDSSFMEAAMEISAPLPYVKFLAEPTEKLREELQHATGEIKYGGTNNYMFQAFLQENNEALQNLICSVLHLDPSSVVSIEITNPILLGKFIENKTFILDIKALMNNQTVINLEMQIEDQHNWPERSLGYLCRSFDNLNTGDEYRTVKPAIHIGFLDFHLFKDAPEFHAVYKLLNTKNMHSYTDKFSLHVIDLRHIELATEEDKAYQTDVWAAFFKAKTWEEMRMLAEKKPGLQSSVETLYQLNSDEQIRETLDRFVRAQRREQGYLDTISEQQDTISEQQDTISEQQERLSVQEDTISEQQEKLSTQENTISSLEQENAALRAELEALRTQK